MPKKATDPWKPWTRENGFKSHGPMGPCRFHGSTALKAASRVHGFKSRLLMGPASHGSTKSDHPKIRPAGAQNWPAHCLGAKGTPKECRLLSVLWGKIHPPWAPPKLSMASAEKAPENAPFVPRKRWCVAQFVANWPMAGLLSQSLTFITPAPSLGAAASLGEKKVP